jgi:hypothetical protein
MSKRLFLYLCVISLLGGVITEAVFLSSGARTQGDGVVVTGADDVSTVTDEHSAGLADSAGEVTSRVAMEYADFASSYESQSSDPLQQTAANAKSRIVAEYADFVTTFTDFPYLGPQLYSDDFNPPMIVVTREPAGREVEGDQDVFVSADITDAESGVRSATLQYTTDNSTDWEGASAQIVSMSLNLTPWPQNSRALSFTATIPGQSPGTYVRFRIIAYDFAGNNNTLDGAIEATAYVVVLEFSSSLILPMFVTATLLVAVAYAKKQPCAREKL